MPVSPGTIALSATVILELLKFAREMRSVFGENVTDEQIADAWSRSVVRFEAASQAWDDAKASLG